MTFDSVATVKTQNNRNPVLLGCFYFPQNLQILLPKINIRLTLSVSQTWGQHTSNTRGQTPVPALCPLSFSFQKCVTQWGWWCLSCKNRRAAVEHQLCPTQSNCHCKLYLMSRIRVCIIWSTLNVISRVQNLIDGSLAQSYPQTFKVTSCITKLILRGWI